MKLTRDYKAKVFDKLFMSDAWEDIMKAELELAYELAEPDDWKVKDALREVIKYYSPEAEYVDFKKRQGIE